MKSNASQVTRRTVTLVSFPFPHCVTLSQFYHQRIPVNLGNIGCSGNAYKPLIGLDWGQNIFETFPQRDRINDDDVVRSSQGQCN